MGDVTEIQQAKAWIYTVLAAETYIASTVGTRIYADYVLGAPSARIFPYCLYESLAAPSINGVGHNRQQVKGKFQIRVVTDGRPDAVARKIGKRIDDIFQNASNNVSGDYQFSSILDREVDRPELDKDTGKYYHNLGGVYDIYINRAP